MTTLIDKEKFSDIRNLSIPVLALDIVIFTIFKWELCIITQKKEKENSLKHVLPGWIMSKWFSIRENIEHLLEKKTWITWVFYEQLKTFWEVDRDPRWHVVSIVYYALVWTDKFLHNVDFTQVDIIKFSDIEKLDFMYDHKKIIEYAKQRLKWKLEYTNVAKDLLWKSFRMSQLQEAYEIVLWEKIDKRNFQKKIFKLKMVEETWELDKSTNRPAKLYKFVDEELKLYEIR
jgi:8-oxo-dGTP diphosphatase